MQEIQKFVWRKHSLERMLERSIGRDEVIKTVKEGEVIEEYLHDFPYPSCLIFKMNTFPLHVVCSIVEQTCYVITVYRPELTKFENDFKTRKKQ